MDGLCQYKDIFGEPGTGVHKTRFLGVAAVDLFMTIAFIIAIAYIGGFDVIHTGVVVFLTGIIAHRLFCVETTIDRYLFGK